MTETKRQVLLVGSMPFESQEDAMRRALDILGADLWALPDGEIGEKSEKYPWVIGRRGYRPSLMFANRTLKIGKLLIQEFEGSQDFRRGTIPPTPKTQTLTR